MQLGESPRVRAGASTPGSLTTVMRAAQTPLAPNVPLVLRIGVVQSGRIVEERIIKQRTTVSIGTSEEATFVCATRTPRFDLFARRKDGYVLRFDAHTSGRVALPHEVVTLDALRGRTSPNGGIWEVALPEEARGKVSVGETTFLFQFVRPPPPQPRPQLPLAVKGGLSSQIDWSLTIIAALSFLLHFGIVGAMYSDWMDVVVDDHRTVAGLVDVMKSLPPAPIETPSTEQTADTTPSETKSTPTSTPTSSNTKSTTGKSTNSTSKSSSRVMSDQQAAMLAEQANQMELNIFASTAGKSSVEGVLRRGDIPPVDLSSRAASNEGVTRSASELHVSNGSTAVAARGNDGLGKLGDTHGNATTTSGDSRNVGGPKIEPQIGALGGGTTVTGADRVVAGLRNRFRACYQKGLNLDPTMSGKVIISAKIGPNGEVSSADVASSTGLSAEVTSCIAGAVKRAQFDPQASPTTLSIPVSFIKQ